MEPDLLTEYQKKAIELVAQDTKLSNFYLTGGTALAQYYFKHRISDDLDFFSFEEIDIVYIHNFVELLRKEIEAKDITFTRLYDRNQFFFMLADNSELKIEFTRYPFAQLNSPNSFDNIKVDNLRDISANKIMAMLDRFDPKDFVDLFFILKDSKLENVRLDAEKKFDMRIDPIFLGSEFLKSERIAALPKMVKPLTIDELKLFFEELAKSLKPEILT